VHGGAGAFETQLDLRGDATALTAVAEKTSGSSRISAIQASNARPNSAENSVSGVASSRIGVIARPAPS
jgi:hypothetical protein